MSIFQPSSVYTTYILYHLYIANWVIICYLPPIKGTRKQLLTSFFQLDLLGLKGGSIWVKCSSRLGMMFFFCCQKQRHGFQELVTHHCKPVNPRNSLGTFVIMARINPSYIYIYLYIYIYIYAYIYIFKYMCRIRQPFGVVCVFWLFLLSWVLVGSSFNGLNHQWYEWVTYYEA